MTRSRRSDAQRAQTNPDAQLKRFMEAARALGADEDEAAFKANLATIARQKPTPDPPAEKPKRAKPAKG